MPEQLITQDCTQAEQVLRKTCSKCKYPKPLIEMVKQRGSPDGLSSWCITCFNKANRIRSLERTRSRQKLINLLKEDPCMDCGNKFPPCCMDFDHVRGSKLKGIGQLYTGSEEILYTEIEKCDLVCAVCHRLRTHLRSEITNKRFAAFYEKMKVLKDKPCVDCGHIFPAAGMDFDHVRGAKELPISKMYTCAWSRVLLEVSKCDLVCACCHRIRTLAQKRAA